ncbi:hypothetical protein [Legionella massiliensis]|nr:hypothetical protein [Legionella massiliensis]
MNLIKHRNLAWIFSFIILGCFILFLIKFATTSPLCCADDAYIAAVSKNLAQGHGYLSTNNSWVQKNFPEKGVLFDPGISTGAPSILSVAIGIYLFGPHPSIPGYVHISLYAVIFMFLLSNIARTTNRTVAGLIFIIFILLIFSTGHKHFEHWFAQLGEILSILLIFTGISVLSFSSPSPTHYFAAGFLIGAAILTKLIIVFYAAAISLIILFQFFQERSFHSIRDSQISISFFIGIAAPIVCFELWKLCILHTDGWVTNWKEMINFISDNGVRSSSYNLGSLLKERWEVVNSHFFLSNYAVIPAIISYPRLFFSLPKSLRCFSKFLSLGLLLQLSYWVFFSAGWPRYLYISIVSGLFLVSIACVAGKGFISRSLMMFSITITLFNGFSAANWASIFNIKTNQALLDAEKISNYIELHYPKEKIMTEWWAHTAALTYLSSNTYRYSIWLEPNNRITLPKLVITNSAFLLHGDDLFTSMLQNSCQIEIKEGNYSLYSCKG